jgi:hypothetical protein
MKLTTSKLIRTAGLSAQNARLSLIGISAMLVITSIHHVFRLGYALLIPAVILTALPYVLWRWHAQSKSALSLGIYAMYNGLMFSWFGFIDGFMDHVLKAIGLANTTFLPGGEAEVVATKLSLWSPAAGNLLYEGTGILTFIVGVFAMVYLASLLRANWASGRPDRLAAQGR